MDKWAVKVLKEVKKHADRDDCYACKQLLREFAERWNIDPDKILDARKS